MLELKIIYRAFSVKVKSISSIKEKKKTRKRFSNPISLVHSNNKDRQQNENHQKGSNDVVLKRASIPSRLSSLSTKDPPKLPPICSNQFYLIELDPFLKSYDEEQQQQQKKRPPSMPVLQSSVTHSPRISKRLSAPASILTPVDDKNTTNDNDDDKNKNNNNNNNISNNNNNNNDDNISNNNNNSELCSRLTGNASRSVPSLTLIRDVDVPLTPSTPTLKKLQFSSDILIHNTWPKEDYDRRGDRSTCNRLTPLMAQRIKRELNEYKLMEMRVHEDSKKNTHLFA